MGTESELSDVVSLMAMVSVRCDEDGMSVLAAINAELEQRRDQLGSMTKLAEDVRRRGICLRNGKEYGSAHALSKRLKLKPSLRVPKKEAKCYPYAKKCLVLVR